MSRQHKVTDVEAALTSLSKATQKNNSTRVIFMGEDAKTDGETIYLPSVSSEATVSSEDAKVIEGYTLHEGTGHIRHTDFDALKKYVEHLQSEGWTDEKIAEFQGVVNGIEDWRIEKAIVENYPGAAVALDATSRAVNLSSIETLNEAKAGGHEVPWDRVGPWAIAEAGRAIERGNVGLHEDALAALPDDVRERATTIIEEARRRCRVNQETLVDEFGNKHAHSKADFKNVLAVAREVVEGKIAPPPEEEGGNGPCPEGEEGKGEGEGTPTPTPTEEGGQEEGGSGNEEGNESGSNEGNNNSGNNNSGNEEEATGRPESKASPINEEFGKAEGVIRNIFQQTGGSDDCIPYSRSYDVLVTKDGPTHYRGYNNAGGKHGLDGKPLEHPFQNQDKGRERFNALSARIKSQTSVIQRELQRALVTMTNSKFQSGEVKGRLDAGRLVSALNLDPYVFRDRQEANDLDVAVLYLVDLSDSMEGRRVTHAALTTMALCKATDAAGIPSEVIGFTCAYGSRAHGTYAELRNGPTWEKINRDLEEIAEGYLVSGSIPRRLGTVIYTMHKQFDERYRVAAPQLGNMVNCTVGWTPTWEALDFGTRRLLSRSERRKVLVCLTDGLPRQPATGYIDERQLTRDAVVRAGRYGIDVMGIGINEDVSAFFDNHVTVRDINSLAKTVMKEVGPILLGTRKSDRGDLIAATAKSKRRAA